MCTAPYEMRWKSLNNGKTPRNKRKCPRFRYSSPPSSSSSTADGKIVPMEPVWFNLQNGVGTLHYDSLMEVWNDYYMNYYNIEYPRLMIRLEDMIYNFPKVMESIRTCIDGTPI